MYNMSDYRAALSERGNYDMDSADWKLAQQKVQSIVAVLVAAVRAGGREDCKHYIGQN